MIHQVIFLLYFPIFFLTVNMGIGRVHDKVNRLASLADNPSPMVSDESFADTLMDAANYALMLHAEIIGADFPADKPFSQCVLPLYDVLVKNAENFSPQPDSVAAANTPAARKNAAFLAAWYLDEIHDAIRNEDMKNAARMCEAASIFFVSYLSAIRVKEAA